MKRKLPNLTRAEHDVMKCLWARGKLSAREVHGVVAAAHDWAYSTTRTTMDRMVKKGLLTKKEFHGLYLYEPRISKPMGLASMVRDFADRVLETDSGAVVSMFASSNALRPEEVEELARLLDEEDKES